MSLRDSIGGTGVGSAADVRANPRNQIHLKSFLNLPHGWEWDVLAHYVDRLPSDGIAAYARLDTRIGWQPAEHWAISLVGQNLLQPRHAEFGGSTANIYLTEVRRSGYAKLTWTF
jgi:iron complex outermembrane receptor protein